MRSPPPFKPPGRLRWFGPLLVVLMVGQPFAALAEPDPPKAPQTSTAAAEQERLDKLAREYDSIAKTEGFSEGKPPKATSVPSNKATLPELMMLFVKMFFVLGAVCLLAYLALGKGLPKLLKIKPPSASKRILKVLDRLPIDQRRSLQIIQIGEVYFLVGVTEQGINLLSRLDSDNVELALTQAELDSPKIGRLAETLMGRAQKESRS